MTKKVIYYEDAKGIKCVKEFLNSLDDSIKGKVLARIQFLGEHWNELRRPYVDLIGDKLYELRVQFAHNQVRIVYAYMFGDYVVLLHGFMKKTSKIPENDKLAAINRMFDFQKRYNEGRIRLR